MDIPSFWVIKLRLKDGLNLKSTVNNPYYIFLLKPKMEKYKKKKNVTSAKACLNEGTVYGPLCAYRLFYVGCSRARKNLLIIINREDVKNFEDKLYEKLKDCGFEVEY